MLDDVQCLTHGSKHEMKIKLSVLGEVRRGP